MAANNTVKAKSGQGFKFAAAAFALVSTGLFGVYVVWILFQSMSSNSSSGGSSSQTATTPWQGQQTSETLCNKVETLSITGEPQRTVTPNGCGMKYDIAPGKCILYSEDGDRWMEGCNNGEKWEPTRSHTLYFKQATTNPARDVVLTYYILKKDR